MLRGPVSLIRIGGPLFFEAVEEQSRERESVPLHVMRRRLLPRTLKVERIWAFLDEAKSKDQLLR